VVTKGHDGDKGTSLGTKGYPRGQRVIPRDMNVPRDIRRDNGIFQGHLHDPRDTHGGIVISKGTDDFSKKRKKY
jgi:hypothetical protein